MRDGFINPSILHAQELAQRFMSGLRTRRRSAFIEVFGGTAESRTPAQDIVLGDLRDFCRARETTFDPDPRIHALLEGRREVWLRIANHLSIDEATMAALDSSRPSIEEDGDE